jgi:threonine dehydrogenase-like Zn-dependent dehydrogenase
MAVRVIFTGKQQVELEEFEIEEPGEGQIVVRSLYSLMSTGTENICFNRLFEEGTHWYNWVVYPFATGYCMVGEVIAVGPGVTRHAVGDKVAMRARHRSHHLMNQQDCYPIPAGIDLKDATWFALAKITFVGARAIQYTPGDGVLVIGAGPIGQMSARWALACGASAVAVVDPWENRLPYALKGGVTATLAKRIEECTVPEIHALFGGRAPRVVVDATGHPNVLEHALRFPANFGRVLIMGDTGFPSRQRLTSDVVTRGITMVGAHDTHNTPEWNNETITEHFFSRVLAGRFDISGLITHTFPGAKCADGYALANSCREETVGILFDWTEM